MIRQRTQTYAVCPSCNKDAGTIDHLLGQVVSTAWYCDHCGCRYRLDFDDDGSVNITDTGDRKIETLDVLKLPPQEHDVYFIVKGMRFEPGENNAQFFYESHSCPTNWLQPELVYYDGDPDPHGLIKFVRRVDAGPGYADVNEYNDALTKLVETTKGMKR